MSSRVDARVWRSRCLAPDAASAAALMAAGVTVPEQAVQALLTTSTSNADTGVVLQLLSVSIESSNLPRAVRIARAAHRAGVITCYSAAAEAAPATTPANAAAAALLAALPGMPRPQPEAAGAAAALRTLHVEYLPPHLVPCVLLAWLTEIAAARAGADDSSDGAEEPSYVVVTGVAAEVECGGGGGSGAVPTLDVWNSNGVQAVAPVRLPLVCMINHHGCLRF